MHPGAKVTGDRKDDYPIKVTVKDDSDNGAVVWSGRQQELFGKNGRPAQKDIINALRARQ